MVILLVYWLIIAFFTLIEALFSDLSSAYMVSPLYTSFEEKIWKVFPDLLDNRLSVETRDSAKKKIYGWSVALDHPMAISLETPESWWCSLKTVHEGYAIWQGIEEEGLPVPLGIYVFHQASGSLAWQAPELKFMHCGPEVIVASKSGSREQVSFWETSSGKLRAEHRMEDLPLDFLEEYELNRFKRLSYPEHHSPETAKYSETITAIPPLANHIGPMSYLKFGEYQIVHRYQLNSDSQEITGILSVIKNGAFYVDEICTGKYSNGFALDSFFVMNNWLVWVEFPGRLGRLKFD